MKPLSYVLLPLLYYKTIGLPTNDGIVFLANSKVLLLRNNRYSYTGVDGRLKSPGLDLFRECGCTYPIINLKNWLSSLDLVRNAIKFPDGYFAKAGFCPNRNIKEHADEHAANTIGSYLLLRP